MKKPRLSLLFGIVGVIVAASDVCGGALRVPEDYPDVQAAVDAAKAGDVVKIAKGGFAGGVRIDKAITLSGAGRDATILRARKGNVVAVSGRVTLEHLTVEGKGSGVYANAGAALTVRHCRIVGAKDGLNFKPHFNTTAVVHHNEFVRCGDAIDLESTQAIIYDNVFRDCRDDAIDFDGDAGGIVFRNTITGCKDDGIEIRLRQTTQAVIVNNTFDGCGEDGIELIDSYVKGTPRNLVVVAGNTFRNCARFGVGGVDQKTEVPGEAMVKAGLYGSGNTFENCGKGEVSPNVGPVDLRKDRTAESVTVEMTVGGQTTKKALPMHTLTPLAVYDLWHDPDGKRVKDAEGVEVDVEGGRIFVADDNSPAIWTMDLRSAQLVAKLRTNPFPGTEVTIKGTEGLAFDPDDRARLWLAADDEKKLVVFSAARDSFGKVLEARPAAGFHKYPEGIAHAGDRVYLVGGRELAAGDRKTLKLCPGFPVTYLFEGYGSHVAGVAFDGKRLLISASAYGGKTQYNEKGLLLAADPSTGEVTEVWSLGDYSSDPRGVAVAAGIVYVADGYGTPTLPGGKTPNRQGLKLFVFAAGQVGDLGPYLHLLPLRQKAAPKEGRP